MVPKSAGAFFRSLLGGNDCANNDFDFFKQDASLGSSDPKVQPPDVIPSAGSDTQCGQPGQFPASPGARDGVLCPFDAHSRKAYPRDDLTPGGRTIPGSKDPEDLQRSNTSEVTTQTHRLLRRGIPWGAVSRSQLDAPLEDGVDRGLLFFAYQTSIERQFEFVTRNWVNNRNFSSQAAQGHECGGVAPIGHDPIIGQADGAGGDRTRTFFINFGLGSGDCRKLTTSTDWVIPTGGGYFFAPSIAALQAF